MKYTIVRETTVPSMLSDMPLPRLLDQWELTATCTDKNISIVRGWLMDELERRNPSAFNAWLDTSAPEDSDLRKYMQANSICHRCKKFLASCTGTQNPVWTGCIYRS